MHGFLIDQAIRLREPFWSWDGPVPDCGPRMSVAVTARLVNDRSGCFRRESASVHPAQQFEGDFAFARSPTIATH